MTSGPLNSSFWFTRRGETVYLTHQFVWCRLFLQCVFWAFSSLVFSVPANRGKVSPGRLVDSCPGDTIHQRGYLLHSFLYNISLDFPLFWTVGYCICGLAVDKYLYTAKTAQFGHFSFTLHFFAKGDKKMVENSGHSLLEEQKHFILGSQTFTCLMLPPFWTGQHWDVLSAWSEPPVSTCKGQNQQEAKISFFRWAWTGAASMCPWWHHEMRKLKPEWMDISPNPLQRDICSWSSHPPLPS